jgi:hypothetical protein
MFTMTAHRANLRAMATRPAAPIPHGGLEIDGSRAEQKETISLTLPHESRFVNVARIVVGGLAARLDLSYERLDDLQLAVETLLVPDEYGVADDVTVEITIAGRSLCIAVGPLDVDRVAADLEQDRELTLGVLLAAVVDSVAFEQRDGGGWVRLEKQVAIPAAG